MSTGLNATFGSLSCDSYTDVCSQFGLTSLPTVLVFTSSSLDSPSLSPAFIGVLDSVHLLEALGQPVMTQKQGELVSHIQSDLSHLFSALQTELTPASFPILLRSSLTAPLVMWCDEIPSSELGIAFNEIGDVNSQEFSFAWINRQGYNCTLEKLTSSNIT